MRRVTKWFSCRRMETTLASSFLAGAAVGMVFPALLTRLGGVLSYPQMLGFGACVAVVTAVFVSVVSKHD